MRVMVLTELKDGKLGGRQGLALMVLILRVLMVLMVSNGISWHSLMVSDGVMSLLIIHH